MAFNTSDTRQRAYNRIDTSSPHGSWIDEKFYNRTGTGAQGKKTLIGNWLEEERLEHDLGPDQSVIRQEGKYFRGGFESTPYLVSNEEPNERRFAGITMHRESFNERNGDIATTKKPSLGVRSDIRAKIVLNDARRAVEAAEEAARQRDAPLTTTYRETVSKSAASSLSSAGSSKNSSSSVPYTRDVPITLYTGNPHTGVAMKVQGKTVDGGTGNPLAKNTSFTFNKFAL